MKRFVFFMFLCSTILQAQEHAWIYFKDKPNAQTYLNNPLSMLSQRAIDRRIRQDISITTQDVPIEESYILSIKNNNGVTVKATSKWLNAVHVFGTETAISNLQDLTCVDSIQFANKNLATINPSIFELSKIAVRNKFNNKLASVYDYGVATSQTEMLGVEKFHDREIEGNSMQIAVIDAGFYGVNTANAFSHLLDNDESNGEILGRYDFVNNTNNFYTNTGTTHGTQVLSTIAAIKESEFIGTAPKASFYLFVTEDVVNESPLEESLWVLAAERADSLGVDIINTSLGYNQFDESKYDYTYADMDGETTFITRGANIAAEKGIVVVNSVGNSGNDAWKFLTAPADAKNIIAVGAVNEDKTIAFFSSFGPSADNRIKPETLAQGAGVFVVNENNQVGASNGTSFSGPIIAGVVACLWEAYPEKSSLEIRQMIIENSELYNSPRDQEGYGVLNVSNLIGETIFIDTGDVTEDNSDKPFTIVLYYDTNTIVFKFKDGFDQESDVKVSIVSALGSQLIVDSMTKNNNTISIDHFSNGLYYLQYSYGNINEVLPILKK